MKIVRVKYVPPLGSTLIVDLQRVFPEWDGVKSEIDGHLKKRHAYAKEFRNELGQRTHVIVYMLAKDSFVVPQWIQGQVLTELDIVQHPIDHYFMGNENPTPDSDDEAPDEGIE